MLNVKFSIVIHDLNPIIVVYRTGKSVIMTESKTWFDEFCASYSVIFVGYTSGILGKEVSRVYSPAKGLPGYGVR